ncbi:MAG: hypothetical protein ABIA63_10010, partial [bacterium]
IMGLFYSRVLADITESYSTVGAAADTSDPYNKGYNYDINKRQMDFNAPRKAKKEFNNFEYIYREFIHLFNKKHNLEFTYYFGTYDRALSGGNDYPLEYRLGINFLRGYPYYIRPAEKDTLRNSIYAGSFSDTIPKNKWMFVDFQEKPNIMAGNRISYLNFAYNFPVFDNIGLQLLMLYLDKLYAQIFFESGAIWNSDINNFKLLELLGYRYDAQGQPLREGSLSGAGVTYLNDFGARLDLKLNLFYKIGLTAYVMGAYRLNLDDVRIYDTADDGTRYRRSLDTYRLYFGLTMGYAGGALSRPQDMLDKIGGLRDQFKLH